MAQVRIVGAEEVFEAIGEQIRKGQGNIDIGGMSNKLVGIGYRHAKAAAQKALNMAARLYIPEELNREEPHSSFDEAMFRILLTNFDKLVTLWAGLSHWNDVIGEKYVKGGPLEFQLEVITNALVKEETAIKALLKKYPEVKVDQELLTRLEFNTACFPVVPKPAAA